MQALRSWHTDLYERSFLALESDMLRGRQFEKVVLKLNTAGDEAESERQSTTVHKVAVDDRALRSCCSNAIAVSVMFLGDIGNRHIVAVVAGLAAPLLAWHSWQDKLLRSVEGTSQYLLDCTTGGFFQHLGRILGALCSKTFMEDAGFTLGRLKGSDVANTLIVEEDERSDLAGRFATALALARLRRCLWLITGWPHLMHAIEKGPAIASSVLSRFAADLEIWQRLKAWVALVLDYIASCVSLDDRRALCRYGCRRHCVASAIFFKCDAHCMHGGWHAPITGVGFDRLASLVE